MLHLPLASTSFMTSVHERKIRRHFKHRFDISTETAAIHAPVNIMVFVNRSGSSLISEYLKATGKFSEFGEPLSSKFVIETSEDAGFSSFTEYLSWLFRELDTPGRQVGMKASIDQVLMLLRSQAIPHLFSNVRWVFVQRLDVLSQAISFCIAEQTGQWHSTRSGNESVPKYVFKDIRKRALSISRINARILSLLSFYNISPYYITYEQFVSDPVIATEKLAAFLGVDDVILDTEQLRLEKQADEINEEFRTRFLSDFNGSLRGNLIRFI